MIIRADAARLPLPDKSVDLVLGSPPYMDCRDYGIGAQRKCIEWVEWMLECTKESLRVCRGLVLWVVCGVTRDGCYWPGPEMLLSEWWKRGFGECWRPCFFHRVGIPGSGGKQWFRSDVEYILCFKESGAIPWSDNTAMGHPPKWAPGGEMSYRLTNGSRVNQWGHPIDSGATTGNIDEVTCGGKRPSHRIVNGRDQWGGTNTRTGGEGRDKNGRHKAKKSVNRCKRNGDGIREIDGDEIQEYVQPVLANPGNRIEDIFTTTEVLEIIGEGNMRTINVGGGLMGSSLSHLNEAPFPEKLAEWFVLSCCPPGGITFDPWSGSGTTASVCKQNGRNFIAGDIRMSQCELTRKRLNNVTVPLFV